MRLPAPILSVLVLAVLPASAAAQGAHSDNMSFVRNIPYAPQDADTPPNSGSDIEFAQIKGRRYALAGSYENGLQIVDVTRPESARTVGVYDCGVTQGDVQVFRQAGKPGRTFATYTSDTFGDGTSTCYREAEALGFEVLKDDGEGKNGTFVVESYLDHPAAVRIAGGFAHLTNLTTGAGLDGEPEPPMPGRKGFGYELRIEPHSFIAFREH